MDQKTVKIEVNGVELQAQAGQMLMEVTDAADIYIPRFCYHEKLSIAANCRMCLVEVEDVHKPLPACATPVTDGMKVFTKSPAAISAQRATMEFLLINHPLDCPICDQGGECELQDLAMGYGRDISRYAEKKRSVQDQNLGPLVSTDMTRCIHCTRCVRFGQEIAGIQELGTMGRGEFMEISTYVKNSVDHELSGNIIDICPVGALNNKPYRYSARAWEMEQRATVAPHDCLGSSIYAHVLRGRVKRVVPRQNEQINETWISDRDRFSYEGIYSDDRLLQPMIRDGGEWRTSSWEAALEAAAAGLLEAAGGDAATHIGAWISPSATTEEAYLTARLMRHLGSNNVDHRLRTRDFSGQEYDPLFPGLGMGIAEVASLEAALIVGSNLRKEVPLLAHRVRQAAVAGASINFLNLAIYDYLFPIAEYMVGSSADLPLQLARLLVAAGAELPKSARLLASAAASVDEDQQRTVASLAKADSGLVLLGQMARRHPQFGLIQLLASRLAAATGVRLGHLTEGGNSAGACLAGALPHRGAGGARLNDPGQTIADMIATPLRGLMLVGTEPERDCADAAGAVAAVESAEFVLALSPYFAGSLAQHADVVLPTGTFAETSGTLVNVEGRWQSFAEVAAPLGEARPAWKVLRVLGNLLELADCHYLTSEAIRDELASAAGQLESDNLLSAKASARADSQAAIPAEDLDIPMYQVDAVVRRARSLQLTRDGRQARHGVTGRRETA